MISISKQERFQLETMGVKMGEDGISHTWSKNRHYFLCESKFNLRKLNELRQNKIVKK